MSLTWEACDTCNGTGKCPHCGTTCSECDGQGGFCPECGTPTATNDTCIDCGWPECGEKENER